MNVLPVQVLYTFFIFIICCSGCSKNTGRLPSYNFINKPVEATTQDISVIVQTPHAATITAIAASSDGRLIASASADGQVDLWSSDGILINKYHPVVFKVAGAPKEFSKVAFSNDSRFLVCISQYQITTIDILSGQVREMPFEQGSDRTILSKDNSMGATIFAVDSRKFDDELNLVIFDTKSNSMKNIHTYIRSVNGQITISNDSQYIAFPGGYNDRYGYLFNTVTNSLVSAKTKDDMWFEGADVDTLTKKLLFVSANHKAYLYNLEGKLITTIDPEMVGSDIRSAYTINNNVILNYDDSFQLYDQNNVKQMSIFGSMVDIDRDNNVIMVKASTGSYRSTDKNKQNTFKLEIIDVSGNPKVVTLANSSKLSFKWGGFRKGYAYGLTSSGVLMLWNRDGSHVNSFSGVNAHFKYSQPDGVVFDIDSLSKRVLVGKASEVRVFDLLSGKIKEVFGLSPVFSVGISTDGKKIASGYADGTVGLWNSDGKLYRRFKAHTDKITHISFGDGGNRILTVGGGVYNVWNENGTLVNKGGCGDYAVTAGRYTPDGTQYVVACGKKNVITTKRESSSWAGYMENRYADAKINYYKNDGTPGKSIRVRDNLEHPGLISNIYFSTDRQKMLTVNEDISSYRGTKYLYDMNGNKLNRESPLGDWENSNVTKYYSLWSGAGDFVVGNNSIHGVSEAFPDVFVNEGKFMFSLNEKLGQKASVLQSLGSLDNVNDARFSANSKYLVAGGKDGLVKIVNVGNQKVLNLLAKDDRWVSFMADGMFDSSVDGGDLLKVGSGSSVYSVDQFAAVKNRPDIILQRMELGETEQINHYKRLSEKRSRAAGLTNSEGSKDLAIPLSEITSLTQTDKIVGIEFKLHSKVSSLKYYNIFVNDVPLYAAPGKAVFGTTLELKENVELTSGKNKIEVSCTNTQGAESYRALRYVLYDQPTTGDLYYVGFGVSKYNNPSFNLLYAEKDASDLGKLLKTAKGKGYNEAHIMTYTDEQVTRKNIVAAKEFLKKAKVDDTLILFIAGHGVHDTDNEQTYYYVTHETRLEDLKGSAASFEMIEDLLQGVSPRKKLFLMDTCESGEMEMASVQQSDVSANKQHIRARAIRGLAIHSKDKVEQGGNQKQRKFLLDKDRYIYNNIARRSGAIVFSSSRGSEFSYEPTGFDRNENGYFTKEVISLLKDGIKPGSNSTAISINEFKETVAKRVSERTQGLQNPVVDRDNLFQLFTLPVLK